MKKLIVVLVFSFLCHKGVAQKADTLYIPLGKYEFLQVGDKIYKVITTLVEVPPESLLSTFSTYWSGDTLGHLNLDIRKYSPPLLELNKNEVDKER